MLVYTFTICLQFANLEFLNHLCTCSTSNCAALRAASIVIHSLNSGADKNVFRQIA